MFMGFGSDGAGTWYIRKKVVDHLPLEMVLAYTERRHGVSIVYVSTGLQVLEEFNETSPQGYNTSWPTVISDENEMKASAKMCYTYDARDVVNLWIG